MADADALSQLSQPMAAVLPVAVAGDKRSAADPISKETLRRKQLRHYDLLPAQILNPMGASGVENVSHDMLWSLMTKGNKAAMSLSEICFEEPERRGVAISRFAEVYTLAINRLKQNSHTQTLLKPEVYSNIVQTKC